MTFDKILDDKRLWAVKYDKERGRNYLLDNGVYDLDGFNDYIDNEQGN